MNELMVSYGPPLLGGILIGLASIGLMFFNGRIAGISGIFGGFLPPSASDARWRGFFVVGLILGGLLLLLILPSAFPDSFPRSLWATLAAGLLVGVGTRLGSGCTSGHGVCGMSRLSPRSIVATLTFIATGAITVYAVRTLFGGTL